MTKAELIDKVHGLGGGELTKKQVGEVVDATFEALGEAIREGRFSYPGFGTFTVKERAAREGRNPKSKEPIQIAASKTVGFKPAGKLKDSL
jgi:DNA-binding protein HU-beta